MNTAISIAEILGHGVEIRSSEAVAIAQRLTHTEALDVDVQGPLGPPAPDNVFVNPDGSVVCRGCSITPAVSEIGILLDTMLRRTTKVPGGLRYLIARALLEVDVQPFDSLADLSAALGRHAQGDGNLVLRALWSRAQSALEAAAAASAGATGLERRQTGPSVAALRRELRAVDRRLFELLAAAEPSTPRRSVRAPLSHWLAACAVAALLLFAGSRRWIDNEVVRVQDPEAGAFAGIERTPTGRENSAVDAPERVRDSPESDRPRRPETTRTTTATATITKPAGAQPVSLVRALDGGDRPMFSPAFGLDGTAIFFHTGRNADARSALMTATRGGADLQVMTILDDGSKNYHVQPSPDGTLIAFDSDRDGVRGVYVANRDGTGIRRVSGDGYAAVPTWAPDGTRLAFVRAEIDRPHVWNLWLLSLARGDAKRLTSFRYGQTWGASWFFDGRRVCYTHEDRLFVTDLDTGVSRRYASPVAGRLVRTPAVSPDGDRVAFQVSGSGAWLLDLTDSSMRLVLSDPTAEEFAWSPDGRRVAFHSRRDGQWGIWILRAS